jgi:hypothetical protein
MWVDEGTDRIAHLHKPSLVIYSSWTHLMHHPTASKELEWPGVIGLACARGSAGCAREAEGGGGGGGHIGGT